MLHCKYLKQEGRIVFNNNNNNFVFLHITQTFIFAFDIFIQLKTFVELLMNHFVAKQKYTKLTKAAFKVTLFNYNLNSLIMFYLLIFDRRLFSLN